MKRVLIGVLVLFFMSCSEGESVFHSTRLKKRVLLIESYDPNVSSFLSDSVIEHYKDKFITKRAYFRKFQLDDEFIPFYDAFTYNKKGILVENSTYNDKNLKDRFATKKYSYDEHDRIRKIVSEKTSPSNLSPILSNSITNFEYNLDTIRVHRTYTRNGETTNFQKTYVIKGNIDSIKIVEDNTVVLFNDKKDIYETRYLGDPNDTYFAYQTEIKYDGHKESLISNFLGNKLNAFLIEQSPINFFTFELSNNFVNQYYFKGVRADNVRRFNYVFENGQVSEVTTSGSFADNFTIKYYYYLKFL